MASDIFKEYTTLRTKHKIIVQVRFEEKSKLENFYLNLRLNGSKLTFASLRIFKVAR